jgi:hypothetical protein
MRAMLGGCTCLGRQLAEGEGAQLLDARQRGEPRGGDVVSVGCPLRARRCSGHRQAHPGRDAAAWCRGRPGRVAERAAVVAGAGSGGGGGHAR